MTEGETYVFDTGPLRHFTQQGWLGVLKFLTRESNVLIPERRPHRRLTRWT